MTDKLALVTAQLMHMRASLDRLHRLASIPAEEFLASEDYSALANHHLQRAVQAMLDIGRHIVIRRRLGRTSSYADIICRLYENGVLPTDLGERLAELARLRNRLVHVYWDVTGPDVREVLETRLEDLEDFMREIVRAIDRENGPNG